MNEHIILKAGLLAGALLLNDICFSANQTALKGGCAEVNITPPVGVWLAGYRAREKPSDGISDELYAKAMVLSDGRNKIAIVSADLLWVPLKITAEVRKAVKERAGIAEENILICATHTHFGPKIDRIAKDWPDAPTSEINQSYVQTLKEKIIDSIITAGRNIKEVKVGVVKGETPEIAYNRRTKRANGSVAMTFRLPPAEPGLAFGPTDPEVCILRVEDVNGALVGAIVNFACHPVCGTPDGKKFHSISADYPGQTARAVEQTEGGVCLFALGTAGDMNPVMADRRNPRSQIGKALGGEVLRRIQFVSTRGDVTLKALKKPVTLPLKENLAPGRIADGDKTKGTLTTEIQVLRIGDIYILGLPGEVLVEIGLEIKRKASIANLFIVSLSNDACGYVCHREAYKEGGYEPGDGTNLAEGAGEIIIKEALDILDQIKQNR